MVERRSERGRTAAKSQTLRFSFTPPGHDQGWEGGLGSSKSMGDGDGEAKREEAGND